MIISCTNCIYSVKYRNLGDGTATNLEIVDFVPAGTSYVPGSLRFGAAGSNYDSPANAVFTDAADGDNGKVIANTVYFTVPIINPDDGAPESGADEGVVYFKITIN